MKPYVIETGPRNVSFSELATLATCEERWHRQYFKQDPSTGSPAMHFGSLIHAMIAHWWETGDVPNAWVIADEATNTLPDEGKHSLSDANWLVARWAEVYANERENVQLLGTEVELRANYTTSWGAEYEIHGHADWIVYDPEHGDVLGELKTSHDFRILNMGLIMPQTTLYTWLAEASGVNIDAIQLQVAKTYRWTRDTHSPEDSFMEEYYYRDRPQIDGALAWMDSILERREALVSGAAPIKNLGLATCQGCTYRPECWDALSFPSEVTVVE